MAYTKAPTVDTYSTKQLPLFYAWNNRQQSYLLSGLDQKQTVAQNVFFEVVKTENTDAYYNVIRRPGCIDDTTVNGNILGMYYWETIDQIVVVTPSRITRFNPTTGVQTETLTASFNLPTILLTGVSFTEFLYDNGTVDLIISGNGMFGTFSTAGVWTPCVDADRPNPNQAYPVFLDGYLFLLDTNGNICNSDLNNPQSWTAGNFISVEQYPDVTTAITRAGPYIAAIGNISTEWFYDAGNPTGTPLARVEGATREIGYIQGLVSSEDASYFVGRSNRGGPSVYKINGLKIVEVGDATVKRWLSNTSVMFGSRGHIFSFGGHTFYVVIQDRDLNPPIQAYMLDLENGMWSSFVLGNDTASPFIFASTTALEKSLLGREGQLITYFSKYQTSIVIAMRPEQLTDVLGGSTFQFVSQFTTRPMNFDTNRIKFASRLLFDTDQTATSSRMSVSWSDDDQQTYSTPRQVDLANSYKPLYACGMFRNRSFKITYADAFAMRWRNVELDYNLGHA